MSQSVVTKPVQVFVDGAKAGEAQAVRVDYVQEPGDVGCIAVFDVGIEAMADTGSTIEICVPDKASWEVYTLSDIDRIEWTGNQTTVRAGNASVRSADSLGPDVETDENRQDRIEMDDGVSAVIDPEGS